MAENTSDAGLTFLAAGLQQFAERFIEGLHVRYLAWLAAPAEFETFRASFAQVSTSGFAMASQILLIVAIVAVPLVVGGRRIRIGTGTAWSRLLLSATVAVIALAIGFVAARLLASQGLPVQTLQLWVTSTVAGWVVLIALHWLLLQQQPPEARLRRNRLTKFVRDLSLAILWAVAGLSLVASLRLWGAGAGMIDLWGTVVVTLPTLLLSTGAIWRHRRTLAGTVAGPRPRAFWRGSFARCWPAIVIGFILFIVVNAQVARTMGVALPGVP